MLLARIIANGSEAVFGEQRMETWEDVVHKTLVLNQYLDFLFRYRRWRLHRKLSDVPGDVTMEFTYQWNRRVEATALERHRNCTNILRDALLRFGHEFGTSFDEFLARVGVTSDTLFFTQFGWPETIRIRKVQRPLPEESQSREYWARRAAEDAAEKRQS